MFEEQFPGILLEVAATEDGTEDDETSKSLAELGESATEVIFWHATEVEAESTSTA